jgi:hypothetical protein
MAKSTDKEIPRPARTSLQATPGSFRLIQAHPAISNQTVTGASSNTPPSPLHAAIRPTFNPAPLSQNVPTGPSTSPPCSGPYSDPLEPPAPAISFPLHCAIKQTHYASYPQNLSPRPSSGFPAQPSHLNTLLPTTSPSLQPPLWHTQYPSQCRNAGPEPSVNRPFEPSQSESPGQRRIEFETSSALKRAQGRQATEAINSQTWIEYEDSIAAERNQNRAPTEANNGQPWSESDASVALERSQTQALAEAINGQSKVEVGASNAQQRSPSRAIAEIDKLMEDDG